MGDAHVSVNEREGLVFLTLHFTTVAMTYHETYDLIRKLQHKAQVIAPAPKTLEFTASSYGEGPK